ncbi:MAG: hypothetical protein KIT16_19515, partial [Rhodospirillaceae bacterium]|nr:hypothetical protein [Rhodospirillaceae bacterium]
MRGVEDKAHCATSNIRRKPKRRIAESRLGLPRRGRCINLRRHRFEKRLRWCSCLKARGIRGALRAQVERAPHGALSPKADCSGAAQSGMTQVTLPSSLVRMPPS